MAPPDTLTDIFLDSPDLKFMHYHHDIAIFRKSPTPETTGRLWFAFATDTERIVILSPTSTSRDLTYALAFIQANTNLTHHFISCRDDERAGVVDLETIQMILDQSFFR